MLEKYRDIKTKEKFGKGIKIGEIPYNAENDDILILEKAILTLPDIDRFILILHDFEKYTEIEVADLLSLKAEDIRGKLINIRKLLETAGGLQNISLPFEERIKQLPFKIEPPHNLWDDIFKELHSIKTQGPDESDEKNAEHEINKKGVFSWFKRNK